MPLDAQAPQSFSARETPDGPASGEAVLALAALNALPIRLDLFDGDRLVRSWPDGGALAAADATEETVDGSASLVHVRDVLVGGRTFRLRAATNIQALRSKCDELFQLAYFDPLTGAPNATFFDSAIETAIRESPNASFAVAAVEIDHFAPINEYYGRSVGDALLKVIAQRLAECVGPDDLLARAGGDQFLLMLAGAELDASFRRRIADFLDRMRHPFAVRGHEILLSASIGVSLYPQHDSSAKGLRDKAETAAAISKRGARGRAAFHDPGAATLVHNRALNEQRLRLAIRDRRILCAFQPKVDIRTGAIVGLEALMRWRDEDGRPRSPGELLALAHSTGLIDEVAALVFEETLASLDAVAEAFGPNVPIGFNISAAQAGDLRFMRNFVDRLVASGAARKFVVEITEEAFLSASRFQSDVVPMLRAAGAQIAIDDFGVGFSSLSTLADVTADELKVDRSFISSVDARPRSQSLLKAIESIGAALGMRVVVEGVETDEELAYLRDKTSIAIAQGYYFSKPVILPSRTSTSHERAGEPVEGARARGLGRRGVETRVNVRREA